MVRNAHKQVRSILSTGVVALFLSGCASTQTVLPAVESEVAQRHAAAVIRDVRAEEATLRADLAAARITAAKKEGELQLLRRHVAEVRRAVEAKQAELIFLRNERDRLVEARNEAEAQLARLKQLSHTVPESNAAQAKVNKLESLLIGLSADFVQLKEALGERKSTVQRKDNSTATADDRPELIEMETGLD
ncbi:hypothetical protein MYX04_13590 [Nitrospiraceae bacterium AH_259_D15_M11_P09]|nr:hypothetical protein [Nitrospiraceae bacterium AH_259_D15_M11_P09]